MALCLVLIPLDIPTEHYLHLDNSQSLTAEDSQPPQITLLTPLNGSIVQPFSWINFSITDNESVSQVLYWWNIGMLENETLEPPYSLMARTSETGHYLIIYANDTSGNWASALFYFITDATAPEITLESPLNMSVNPSGTLVNTTVSDLHLDTVLYNWDRSLNVTLSDPYDMPLVALDAYHQLNVYANDSAGNWGHETFILVTDDFPPEIIPSLDNESVVRSGSTITIEIADISADTVEYWWNNENRTSGSWDSFEVTIPQGEASHALHILANDSLGRSTNQTLVYMTDNTKPSINVTAPSNNTVQNSGQIVTLSATDLHLDTILFSWDDGPDIPGTLETSIPVGDGTHILIVRASDTAGNWAQQTLIWVVDDTSPQLSHPSDMIVVANSTGRTVAWTPSDTNPAEYLVLLNGSVIASGSWASGIAVSVEIDSTSLGVKNYTILIWDDAGNQNSDQVIVRIQLQSISSWLPTLLAVIAVASVAVSIVSIILLMRYRSIFKKK